MYGRNQLGSLFCFTGDGSDKGVPLRIGREFGQSIPNLFYWCVDGDFCANRFHDGVFVCHKTSLREQARIVRQRQAVDISCQCLNLLSLSMAFNGRFILNIADFARKQGADYEALVALSGHSEEFLTQPDSTINRPAYNRVLETAVDMTGDPYIGLHMGEGLGLAASGLIGQITQTSATVREALEYCCAFANLGCSELPMSLERSGTYWKVQLRMNPLWEQESPLAYRHTAEGVLAFTLRECRDLTRQRQQPFAIHLPWAAPTDTREYQRVFGTVHFQQDEFAILLHGAQLDTPIITADYQLLRILVAHAEERSAQLKKAQGFATVVRQSMLQLIKPSFPSIDQVAQHLNLSLRTLQRRLQDEGVSYKQLLEEVRKDFAMSYLRNPELSISEIAYLLGYRETSAFSRACKRWLGQSPQQWRTQLNAN